MSWVTLASDDFNRADGLLTSPWERSGWHDRPMPRIVGGRLATSVSGQWGAALRQDLVGVNAKQFAQWDHIYVTPWYTYSSGALLRCSHTSYVDLSQTANQNFYYVAAQGNDDWDPMIIIYLILAGSFTQLGSNIYPALPRPTTGTLWTVRGEADGSDISTIINGQKGTRTDASIPTGKPAGLLVESVYESRLDNWSCGHWVAAPTFNPAWARNRSRILGGGL